MQTKTIIITGATSGIGKAAATELANSNTNLILAIRNLEKGEATKIEILRQKPEANIDVMHCDLADLDSVKQFAHEFTSKYQHLDVLINNAGLATMTSRQETKQGFEYMFGVNHLGHFLLTNLLLDTLKKSTPSRIINVSSNAHQSSRGLNFNDLQSKKSFFGFSAYANSKLANIYFTTELAKRLAGTGVNSYVLHPGVVNTHFFSGQQNPIMSLLGKVLGLFLISPEKGAETTVYLATSDEVAEESGNYYYKKQKHSTSKIAQDETAANHLWEVSTELVRDYLKE